MLKEDSGITFLQFAYLLYKQLINSRSLSNLASRICKVSAEVLLHSIERLSCQDLITKGNINTTHEIITFRRGRLSFVAIEAII